MNKTVAKENLLIFFSYLASAVMLTFIQVPFGASGLAWVGLVPLILVSRPNAKAKHLVVIGYLVCLCYWLGNLYWLGIVTVAGWIGFCLYMGLYWPVFALCIRFCRMKKVPLILAVPVLLVGAEALQGYIWTGFSWRFLAHSQYANIRLIQIADIFGAAGVSFLVAMANGVVAGLLIDAWGKKVFRAGSFIKLAVTCAAIIGAVVYGNQRINESDKFITTGPLVAAVQSNVPQKVKESGEATEEILDFLLGNTSKAVEASAELVVWPETMVQAMLNEQILVCLASSHEYHRYDKKLCEHAKKTNAYLLVGAPGGRFEVQNDVVELADRYNSAYLYRPDGQQDRKRYDKIHIVPFGEFVPFKENLRFVHKLLMKLTPYDYDYSLSRGTEYTVFEMKSGNKDYKFSVMICYEDTTPHIARRFAVDGQGNKQVDWLVNISNDGWFVRTRDEQVYPTTELAQHAAICVFRAVENRVSILRSVNTGASCLIDSLGRITDGFVAGSSGLPTKALARTGMAGWFADRIEIDKRATFFSKYGQWLDFCCAICLLVTIIMLPMKFGRKYTK